MNSEEMKLWIQGQLAELSAAETVQDDRRGGKKEPPYETASPAERAGMRIAYARMFTTIRENERAQGILPAWANELEEEGAA